MTALVPRCNDDDSATITSDSRLLVDGTARARPSRIVVSVVGNELGVTASESPETPPGEKRPTATFLAASSATIEAATATMNSSSLAPTLPTLTSGSPKSTNTATRGVTD